MENIIFERDYTQAHKDKAQDITANKLFEQAYFGDFIDNYQKAMDAVPKVIVPEYKANYEYLLSLCDTLAKQWGGSVRGVIDYNHWDAQIDLIVPFAEFSSSDELQLLRDMAEKAHSVTFQPTHDGKLRIHLFNLYFEELISEEHRGFIEYEAIMKDEKLAEMLGLSTEPSPEIKALADFFNGLLDEVEEATGEDRTNIFKALIHRASLLENIDDDICEQLERIAQEMIDESNSM